MLKKKPRWCQKPKISKPGCCLKLCEPIIWNHFFSARFLAYVRQGLGAPSPIHHEGKDDVVLGCCGMPSWLGALLAGTPPQNVCWGYPWELATRERCENPKWNYWKTPWGKGSFTTCQSPGGSPQHLGDPKVSWLRTWPIRWYRTPPRNNGLFLNGNNAIIIQEDACFK